MAGSAADPCPWFAFAAVLGAAVSSSWVALNIAVEPAFRIVAAAGDGTGVGVGHAFRPGSGSSCRSGSWGRPADRASLDLARGLAAWWPLRLSSFPWKTNSRTDSGWFRWSVAAAAWETAVFAAAAVDRRFWAETKKSDEKVSPSTGR